MLPPAPARVIDVGGATGVYAGPLAAAGYDVTVVDPVPSHVEAARKLPGVTAVVGDARSLPQDDAGADAVVLLGPLYHLPHRDDRMRAWREAVRVTRPGGVVAGAVISRFASLCDGFAKGFLAVPGFADIVRRALADGVHRNEPGNERWFTSAYFHHPDEPATEAIEAGLTGVRTVAVEGPAWMAPDLPAFLADPAVTLELLRRIEDEPSIRGTSSHLITVGRVGVDQQSEPVQ